MMHRGRIQHAARAGFTGTTEQRARAVLETRDDRGPWLERNRGRVPVESLQGGVHHAQSGSGRGERPADPHPGLRPGPRAYQLPRDADRGARPRQRTREKTARPRARVHRRDIAAKQPAFVQDPGQFPGMLPPGMRHDDAPAAARRRR